MQPTDAGWRKLSALTEASDALARATAAVRQEAALLSLTVKLPAIAQPWLRPRLTTLEAAIPRLSVAIKAMEAARTTLPAAPRALRWLRVQMDDTNGSG